MNKKNATEKSNKKVAKTIERKSAKKPDNKNDKKSNNKDNTNNKKIANEALSNKSNNNTKSSSDKSSSSLSKKQQSQPSTPAPQPTFEEIQAQYCARGEHGDMEVIGQSYAYYCGCGLLFYNPNELGDPTGEVNNALFQHCGSCPQGWWCGTETFAIYKCPYCGYIDNERDGMTRLW